MNLPTDSISTLHRCVNVFELRGVTSLPTCNTTLFVISQKYEHRTAATPDPYDGVAMPVVINF